MFNLKIWWADDQLVVCDTEVEGKKVFVGFVYAFNRTLQRVGLWQNMLESMRLEKAP